MTSLAAFTSMLFPIILIAWKLKNRIDYEEPTWDFRIREVPISEYGVMMKDYVREYSHLISRVLWLDILLLLILGVVGTALPFILQFSIPLVLLSPYLYGASMLAFGIILAHFLIQMIENDATGVFLFVPPSRFERALVEFSLVPGLSWIGIRIAIGEASGFYIIRDPVVVGRVEAIESSGRLDGVVDKRRNLIEVTGHLTLQPDEDPLAKTIRSDTAISSAQILDLVRWTLREYVSKRGSDELLSEVIEDVGLEEE
jgi:hypothetical protein